MLRVGDRQGQVLPAELISGGRSLLAELPDGMLQRLYLRTPGDDELDATDRRLDPAEFDEFLRELNGVRRAGFAVNVEQTEEGVAAFAISIHNHAGRPIGAISVSVPTVRYQRHAHGPAGRADEARGAGNGSSTSPTSSHSSAEENLLSM